MNPSRQRLVKEAVGTKEEPTPWPAALIIGLFAALMLGISVFSSILSGRKQAALAHKLDVIENDKRQKTELFDKLEENEEKRQKLDGKIQKLESKREEVENKLQSLETGRQEFKKKLAAATDWDDVL